MPPRRNKRPPAVDRAILDALLAQPGVAEHVATMTPAERAWYERLLVEQGIYRQYVKERQAR